MQPTQRITTLVVESARPPAYAKATAGMHGPRFKVRGPRFMVQGLRSLPAGVRTDERGRREPGQETKEKH
jgi:hypothetical protein